MGPLGVPELIIIFIVALVVFGPRKLPELGRSLGKSISEFKRASNELRHTLDEEIQAEDRRAALTAPSATAAAPASAAPVDAGSPDDDYDAGYPDSDPPRDDDQVGVTVEEERAEDTTAATSNPLPDTVARGQHG